MPTVNLSFLNKSFLNRGKIREVCRVCHELAEMKADRLCAHCVWIKTKISTRFAEAIRGSVAVPAQQQCQRHGCVCAACDSRTLAAHPMYVFDLTQANRREIHFHPRCHDLWLETVNGPSSGPEQAVDVGHG